MILCLCKKCGNINWHIREVVYEHLIVDGFIRGYKKWIFHGECKPHRTSSTINLAYPHNANHQSVREVDMEGMLRDAFNMRSHNLQFFPPEIIASDDCDIGGNAFTETGRSVPNEEPNGEATKFYKNIEDVNEDKGEAQSRKKPINILRYFPLTLRLQRLFMSSKTADSMSYEKMNQPPNMQTKRRLSEVHVGDVGQEIDDESDEEDDPNEADLWKKRSIFLVALLGASHFVTQY
ncbi:hypothetical protein J1N35_007417 [Gossypium stocksii]|uniref:Transposase-associated domain-containing protein n=1 Tax=Gossypium stocksii TaxID=47602 RepID=A0A9D3W614_9ROSI|nr:hypothetical protein J1N35_007417 [Gossypium stocksii]